MGEHWRRLLFLFRRRRLEGELGEEMRFHLEMAARANRERGLEAEEAGYAARRRFGNATRLKEDSREAWGWGWLDRLAQDLRYALRGMRRNPGFTAAAAITLALGIGANTAIFSVTYALLLRMMPVAHPEELKLVVQHTGIGRDIYSYSYPAYRMLREQSRSLAAISAVSGSSPAVVQSGGEEVERPRRQYVSADLFATLGLHPSAGRLLSWEEDRKPLAVISYAYWQRKYNGSAAAVGAGIIVDEDAFTIAGVAPPGFSGVVPGQPTDIWTPARTMRACVENPGCQTFRLLARVKPGIADTQAAAELDTIFRPHLLERARGLSNPYDRQLFLDRRLGLVAGGAGDSYLGREYARPLRVLMALVGLVLLLACANVANMLLARAAARSREVAVRLAIGAGRWRLLRQLLTESLALAGLGGALGLVFAVWGARALVGLFPAEWEIRLDVTPDLRVLAFTACAALGAGLLFGMLPAFRAARGDVAGVLKGSASGTGGRTGRWAVGRLLVVSQVALSVLLLVGAGLFIRTLRNLKVQDAGFSREQVLTFRAGRPRAWKPEQIAEARQRLLERVRGLPGVVAAGTASPEPLSGNTWNDRADVEGYAARPDEDTGAHFMAVSPGFFEAMRTPLLLGRAIGDQDRAGAPAVAVVNESFARYFCAGRSPLGLHAAPTYDQKVRYEIVGVVGDARYVTLRQAPPRMMFLSAAQQPRWEGDFLVRTRGDPRALARELRTVARGVSPALRVESVRTLAETADGFLTRERMLARLSGFFGALALAMAALGLYGVISYAVSQRTNEIGIRMALGASRRDVLSMVLKEASVLVAVGAAMGIPVAAFGGRFVRAMLFGLEPTDAATLAGCTLLLLAVALFAAYLPGRRAMRVEPVRALRYE